MSKKKKSMKMIYRHGRCNILSFILLFTLVFSEIIPANVIAKSITLENEDILHETRKYYDYDEDNEDDKDINKENEDTSSYTKIFTINDLIGINNNPNGNYILMNDIDMTEETRKGGSWDTGHGWTPLDRFSGILDGNGHRIIGMNIYDDGVTTPQYAGLFSEISGCVKNIGMIDVNIDNIHLAKDDYGYIDTGLGAIAGYLDEDGKIKNCYVTGNISENDTYDIRCTGGLVGSNSGEISNSYNAAKVAGMGIAGTAYLGHGTIRYCYNIGDVGNNYPISARYGDDYDYNCGIYSSYALQGKSLDSTYVKMLTEAQMRIQNMYVGFDFKNTWEIDPNSTYPYPQLKSNRHQRVDGFDIVTLPTKVVYNQDEKIDLSGGTAKVIYEGGYSTTIVLTDNMLNEYDTTKIGEQDIFIEYGGKKTSFTIMVADISVTSVKIKGEGNNLAKGNSMQLEAVLEPKKVTYSTVTWQSSDTNIATVDENGKVNALQSGKVTITATAVNGVSAQYSINITVPCVLLQLNQTKLHLYKDDTFELIPTLSPIDTTDSVSYKTSNPNIATVNDNGKITGCAAGQVKITATVGDIKETCNVTVKRKLEDFHIEGIVDKKYTGDEIEQKIKVTDDYTVLDEDTDYEINYIDNIEIGVAGVEVIGKGYYEGTIQKTFNIIEKETSNRKTLGQTKISTIKNINSKKIKVTFKAVKGADGYEIRYSVKSSMKDSKSKKIAKTSYTISSLMKKKYYVQVRAYYQNDSHKLVYGQWSTKKSIKIKE